MGKLIIDGNSVFEIDEECLKNRKVPKSCDIDKYLKNDMKFYQNKATILNQESPK